jgi:uncharacterized pyridoxal phosphate-containing UPF0001 family protein
MTSLMSVAMTTSPASFASNDLVQRVAANLADVRGRIVRCGRTIESVRIVGVTKTFGVDVVRAASAVGLHDVGENYLDELEEKNYATDDLDLTWYFLGAVQTNKITRLTKSANVLCAVSRVKEIERIARARPGMSIYMQVDCTQGVTRNGAPASDIVAPTRADLRIRRAWTHDGRTPGRTGRS